ncbi:MAG: prolipoprotein diacylglyceryl transferase family protein [Planctomycetaceae bacterium]
MRPILLWISLENPWATGVHNNVASVGAGYLWLAIGFAALGWSWLHRKNFPWKESTGNLLMWGIGGVAVHLAFPIFGLATIPINGYGFMLFLGFASGGWLASRRAVSVKMQPNWVWDAGLWIFIAGIFGARLFYCLQYPQKIFGGKQGIDLLLAFINLPSGGIVLYGGVIGGAIAFFFILSSKTNLAS